MNGLALALLLLPGAFAQQPKETFDVLSFTAPSGWKREARDAALVFSKATAAGGFCILTLHKSGEGTDDVAQDFAAEWERRVAKPLEIAEKPTPQAGEAVSGWKNLTGGARFDFEGSPAVAVLSTFTKNRRAFSYVLLLNDPALAGELDPFVASLELKDAPPPEPPATPAGEPAGITGTWMMTSAVNSSNTGVILNQGYVKRQYTFRADGTYTFFRKTFDLSATSILLHRESGTYTVAGGQLVVTPKVVVVESWSKKDGADKWGARLSSKALPLEKTAYAMQKRFFEGIGEWNLVLKPPKQTAREGAFSSNSEYPNSYLYDRPRTAEYLIELPGGG